MAEQLKPMNHLIIGKNENFEFPLWEIKLENGKILTEARYRFDVLTEPEVSNDPGNSDSPPTVPEELMHLVFPLRDCYASCYHGLQNDIDVSNI
jgi:hypothetical protein